MECVFVTEASFAQRLKEENLLDFNIMRFADGVKSIVGSDAPSIGPYDTPMESFNWPIAVRQLIIDQFPNVADLSALYAQHTKAHPQGVVGRYRFGQSVVNRMTWMHDPTLFYLEKDERAFDHILKHYVKA